MLNASCSPGPDWAVGIRWEDPGSPALLIYLDPESVVIHPPAVAGGDVLLSQFLREISRNAGMLATELEGRRVMGIPPDEPLTH